MHEPLRFIFIEPQLVQVSPVNPWARAVERESGSDGLMETVEVAAGFGFSSTTG